MRFRKTGDRYLVFVQKDEPVLETLTAFCREQGIYGGQLFGIGALKDVELGAYDPVTREYTRRVFPGNYELLTCQGNITRLQGEPFIHAHVTIGDHNFNVKGGHLFAGRVAVVGEFAILPLKDPVDREVDPDLGLATWSL